MDQPSYFLVIAKIQNPLDDVAGVFFGINGFGINIPEQFLPKSHTMIVSFFIANV